MLLQRLRTAEPAVEAAIAYSLVDLAIISPEPAFLDIIKAFSIINRTANPDDPRFSNNVVRNFTCVLTSGNTNDFDVGHGCANKTGTGTATKAIV